jgi:hypothetical protein
MLSNGATKNSSTKLKDSIYVINLGLAGLVISKQAIKANMLKNA